MTKQLIEKAMLEYVELTQQLAALQTRAKEQRQAATPAEVQQALADIETAYQPLLANLNQELEEVKADIKQWVWELEESVACPALRLRATYYQGRVTWDNDKLDGYALAHPELLTLRKQGQPYVVFPVQT